MRIHSNYAREDQPTPLAILETLTAMSISVAAAIIFDTLVHIYFGFILAPFLLLKSDTSIVKGVALFRKVKQFIVIQHIVENRGHTHRTISAAVSAFLNTEIIGDVSFSRQPDDAAINRAKPKAFPSLMLVS